nr:unnamed protein product [Callosobruchus analis]CAI5870484.1 unnamed protein product [Callosobruchus analis]
MKGLITSEQ